MNRNCPNCGAPVEEGHNFCASCGTKIEAEIKEETVIENTQAQPVQTQTVQTQPVQTNSPSGLSIAGFVVSLVSMILCCGSISIVSLILSIVGLNNENKNNGSGTGKGLAIAGIIISVIGILIIAFFIIFCSIVGSDSVVSNAQYYNSI